MVSTVDEVSQVVVTTLAQHRHHVGPPAAQTGGQRGTWVAHGVID